MRAVHSSYHSTKPSSVMLKLLLLSLILANVGFVQTYSVHGEVPLRPAAQAGGVACENDPTLIACWRMEEGSGATIYDGGVAPLNNGSLIGAPTFGTGRNGARAISLNGTTQYASIPDADELDIPGNQLTIAAWVKTTVGSTQFIVNKNTGGSLSGFELGIDNNKAYLRINGNATYQVISSSNISLTDWTHIAATYNGDVIRIFLNGVAKGYYWVTIGIIGNSTSLGIGGRASGVGSKFTGQIDDVRIYNRVLSPTEISGLYNMPQTIDLDPPDAPVNLSATPGLSQVTLNWTANTETDLDHYNIYRSTSLPVSLITPIMSIAGGTTTYTDALSTPDDIYYYVVTAIDTSLNRSSESNTVSNGPTAVTVSNFAAQSFYPTVRLSWTTANEVGLQGFNLYRAETVGGLRELINSTLIPAQKQGQPVGTTYEFLDPGGWRGRQYYWLELVTVGGETQLEGPVIPDPHFWIRLPFITR